MYIYVHMLGKIMLFQLVFSSPNHLLLLLVLAVIELLCMTLNPLVYPFPFVVCGWPVGTFIVFLSQQSLGLVKGLWPDIVWSLPLLANLAMVCSFLF